MGLLDFLSQGNGDPNSGGGSRYSDVPIGYRLGLLGNILASAAQGQAPSPAGFIGMAKLKEDAKAQRLQAHQMELASRYLDKRPDLKPLVESGAISIADIIKMDREDATKQGERDWWKEQEQWKIDHDPNAAWFKDLTGGGGAAPAPTPAAPGVEAVTPPAVPGATPAAPPVPGVPPAPGATPPDMPPVPGTEANAPVSPVTLRLREKLHDPNLNDNEASYIVQTVRNPDDLRGAYDTILKNRTEQAKVAAEQEKLSKAEQEEAAKKEKAKQASNAERMTAIQSIDGALTALDAPGAPAAGVGAIWSSIPTTNAGALASQLTTLKSFISIDKMAEMRANSPSGSTGMGQVSNFEERMLAASQGAIDQTLDPEILRANLKVVRTKIIDFNTPSREDPSKSVMQMNSEKLAADPSPENIAKFEKKYGVGSSSLITQDTTPATERPGNEAPATNPEVDSILQQYGVE